MSANPNSDNVLLYSDMSKMEVKDLPAMCYTKGEDGRIHPAIILRRDPNTNEILCHNCNSGERPTKECSRCSFAFYCGPDCQRDHWDQHKAVCNAFAYANRHGGDTVHSDAERKELYRTYAAKYGQKEKTTTKHPTEETYVQESLMTHVGAISKF